MSHTTVNTSVTRWWSIDFRSLWKHRSMLRFLIWKDIVVRYKQTVVGIAWIVIQPFVEMLVFTLVFHHFVGITSTDLPYPVFVYIGILVWTYFTAAVHSGAVSLVTARQLLHRMSFPRLYIPFSSIVSKLVDAVFSFAVLCTLLLWFDVPPSITIVWIIPLMMYLAVFAFGISLWLSALHALYHDVGFVVPYALRMLMFLTPVMYPIALVSERWQWLSMMNPVAATIEISRAAIAGTPIPFTMLIVSSWVVLFTLIGGVALFQKLESRFIDVM
ncbi:MAG: ABC transporter permease [bacterium]|nr:ABC transporter permease [bacterium]